MNSMTEKICMFTIDDLFGKQTGGIKRFVELYRYFKNNGYDVTLYSGTPQESLAENGIEGKTIELNGERRGFLGVAAHTIYLNNKDIYKEIKNAGYTKVISFDVPSTIGLSLSGVKHICYFVRQDFITYRKIQYKSLGMNPQKAKVQLAVGKFMESKCISAAELIVSQCDHDLNMMKQRHPMLKNRIEKISRIQINNINPSWNNVPLDDIPSEKAYDVCYVGSFEDKRKGYLLFLKAVKILREEGHDYKVVMVGNGRELDNCREKFIGDNNITFTGFQPKPLDYVKSSKLMVVPSYADSCPNTIMESLYVNTPVIGANSSGIPDILAHNKNWLFPLNPRALASKIRDCLKDETNAEMAREQKVRADELTFDWGKKIADIVLDK